MMTEEEFVREMKRELDAQQAAMKEIDQMLADVRRYMDKEERDGA
jgi:hypothetical protein